ncbi:MAG: cupin domain-containing protein [Promethearchaeota archaeon]
MQKVKVSEVPVAKTPHGVDVRKLYNFEHATFVHIRLEPGETLKKHVTPVDVCFFGLEGTGKVEIGGEVSTISQDELVFSPAKIPHRLFNESDGPFRFLVVKTPTPTSETKIL